MLSALITWGITKISVVLLQAPGQISSTYFLLSHFNSTPGILFPPVSLSYSRSPNKLFACKTGVYTNPKEGQRKSQNDTKEIPGRQLGRKPWGQLARQEKEALGEVCPTVLPRLRFDTGHNWPCGVVLRLEGGNWKSIHLSRSNQRTHYWQKGGGEQAGMCSWDEQDSVGRKLDNTLKEMAVPYTLGKN